MSNLFTNLKKHEQIEIVGELSDDELVDLFFNWEMWARPEQIQPLAYEVWAIIAGRGFGKTRTGAETTIDKARSGLCGRIALIGQDVGAVRDVMIEGESGILACSHPKFRPLYTPSKRKLEWPNGALAFTYSAEDPESLRGPQHHFGWGDEVAAWRYWETWEHFEMGLRLGNNPQACITTTPKPRKEFLKLLKENGVVITKGSTLDNKANLAKKFLSKIFEKYDGTRLGRQELYAELLEEAQGALWKRRIIDEYRVSVAPELLYIVVAIDPATTSDKKSNETGIVAAGLGVDGRFYILADVSLVDTPENWSKKAVTLANELKANAIIGEANNGGDLIKTVIGMHECEVPYSKVWASRGKQTRAEPVSMLYEQGKVSHVGYFAYLEDEMCTWEPLDPNAASPNRVDAAVWALTALKKGIANISADDFELGGIRATSVEYNDNKESFEDEPDVNYLTQADF